MRPSFILITESAISAMASLCVMIIIVVLNCSLIFSMNLSTLLDDFESSAPVSSSHKSIFGFFISALAIAALCCCQPESSFGKRFLYFSMSSAVITSSISRGFFEISDTTSIFSCTVRSGIKL